MDDKTKIKVLQGLLAASAVSQLVWMNAGLTTYKTLKKTLRIAKVQQKAVESFMKECEERGQVELLAAVMNDIAFDVITMDVDL